MRPRGRTSSSCRNPTGRLGSPGSRPTRENWVSSYSAGGSTCGPGLLTLNLGRLGHSWFNQGPCEDVDELLVHEFAHEVESNHLSEKFHKAICRVAADLCALAITNPGFFTK